MFLLAQSKLLQAELNRDRTGTSLRCAGVNYVPKFDSCKAGGILKTRSRTCRLMPTSRFDNDAHKFMKIIGVLITTLVSSFIKK